MKHEKYDVRQSKNRTDVKNINYQNTSYYKLSCIPYKLLINKY